MPTFQIRTAHTLRALRLALPLLLFGTGAVAANGPDSVVTQAAPPVDRAPGESATLTINNREIVEFRAHVLGYGPKQRADAAFERVRNVTQAHPRSDEIVSVKVTESELGRLFHVDDRWVFAVTPGDVNALSDETFDQLVARTKLNLEAAVSASLEQRTVSRLVRSLAFSVLATVLLWLGLRGLRWMSRWVARRIESAARGKSEIQAPHMAVFRQVGTLLRGVLKLATIAFGLVLGYTWLTFVLKQFPYTYPWGDQIDDFLITAASRVGLGILHSIPKLLMLALILLIGRFVVRWVYLLFEGIREGRIEFAGIDAETAVPIRRLVTLVVWVITVALAYPFIPGSDGVAFKGLSVLLGVMISLGSSNVISQAASGYMLMFSKAVRTNDFVRVGEYEGTVLSVGMLSTKIRTLRNEEINVPNAVMVGSTLKNYTRLNLQTGAPLTTTVTIGYSVPWRQVHAMLLEAAERTAGIRREPAPLVQQTALSDFYVEYTLIVRLEVPQTRGVTLSELHENIQDIFNVHGVQIMSPHYEGDPDGKVWVPKDKWYEAPAGRGDAPARPGSKGTS